MGLLWLVSGAPHHPRLYMVNGEGGERCWERDDGDRGMHREEERWIERNIKCKRYIVSRREG